MTSLLGLINKNFGENHAVNTALNQLHKRRSPIRVEVENTLLRFDTKLRVHKSSVVVAKPFRMAHNLEAGDHIRFRLPSAKNRELRLKIRTSHFVLSNGTPVFVCDKPTQFIEGSGRRESYRFNTKKYNNLFLHIPELTWKFNILDISKTGCKIYAKNKDFDLDFPQGTRFNNASILLGDHVRLPLDLLAPRMHKFPELGLKFEINPNEHDRKVFTNLMDHLERKLAESHATLPLN